MFRKPIARFQKGWMIGRTARWDCELTARIRWKSNPPTEGRDSLLRPVSGRPFLVERIALFWTLAFFVLVVVPPDARCCRVGGKGDGTIIAAADWWSTSRNDLNRCCVAFDQDTMTWPSSRWANRAGWLACASPAWQRACCDNAVSQDGDAQPDEGAASRRTWIGKAGEAKWQAAGKRWVDSQASIQ